MADKPYDHVAKTTPNITAEQIEKLKELFPECVSEGKVDFDRLRATLGENDVLAGDDGYSFTWAGKEDAFEAIQTPSAATLKPVPDESVNFDDTKHIFIEGENLEVLKLLYKSYFGKVKMIYIDPPYNTGNDFVYQDDYSDTRRAYLEKTGQLDAEGNVLTSNPETHGRFHSAWLNMMYPRLFLARQLLRDDGVIFVSIDDHEVHNLRLLLNEIYGEENFVATLVRKRRMPSGLREDPVSPDHEYVLTYAKSKPDIRLFGTPRDKADYPYQDEYGMYRSTDLTVGMTKEMRPNQYYEIRDPRTGNGYWPPEDRVWRFQPSTMESHIQTGNIIWPEDYPDRSMTRPRFKTRYDPTGRNPVSTWIDVHEVADEDLSVLTAGLNEEATKELREIFGSRVLEYPKPVSLLKALVRLATGDDEDLVLDFFAGSGTTAQAVLECNKEDANCRRFLLIQLSEKTQEDSQARRDGFENIADIARERIVRVLDKMATNGGGQSELPLVSGETDCNDGGFKFFVLHPSNYRHWELSDSQLDDGTVEQLALFEGGLEPEANLRDVIYEVLLKQGYSLNSTIDKLDLDATDNQIFRVTDELPDAEAGDASRYFYICLDETVQVDTLDALDLNDDITLVCLDSALDDSLKLNLAEQCRLKVI